MLGEAGLVGIVEDDGKVVNDGEVVIDGDTLGRGSVAGADDVAGNGAADGTDEESDAGSLVGVKAGCEEAAEGAPSVAMETPAALLPTLLLPLLLFAGPKADSRKPDIRSYSGRVSGSTVFDRAGLGVMPVDGERGAVMLFASALGTGGSPNEGLSDFGLSLTEADEESEPGSPDVAESLGGGSMLLVMGSRVTVEAPAVVCELGLTTMRAGEPEPLNCSLPDMVPEVLPLLPMLVCPTFRESDRVCPCSVVGEPISRLPKLFSLLTNVLPSPDCSVCAWTPPVAASQKPHRTAIARSNV